MVSVIMPVYCGEKFIKQAIESVIGQSYVQWELIIIDDASTDNTNRIIQDFQKQDSRIKIIQNKENHGPGYSRNFGIKNSDFDWIAFLDADDVWMLDKLQKQMDHLCTNNADICSSNNTIINSDGKIIAQNNVLDNVGNCIENNEFLRILFELNILINSSVLVRKELLFKAGLFQKEGINSRKSEDYDLWLRLAKLGVRFCAIPECLIKYRLHNKNSSQHFCEMRLAELSVLNHYKADENIPFNNRKKRFIALYYDLLNVLIQEGKFEEARCHVNSLIKWNTLNLKSWLKYILIHLSPRLYRLIQKDIN